MAIERIRMFRCIERRLDELSAITDAAERNGRLPPIGDIGGSPARPYVRSAWTGVESSDLPNHLDRERRTALGAVYDEVALMETASLRETLLWADLWQVVGPGRRLDAQSAASLRQTIGQVRFANRYLGLVSGQFLEDLRALPIEVDEAQPFLKTVRDEDIRDAAACRPIGSDAPASYGAAPWANALPEIKLERGDKGPPPAPAY